MKDISKVKAGGIISPIMIIVGIGRRCVRLKMSSSGVVSQIKNGSRAQLRKGAIPFRVGTNGTLTVK